MKNKTSILLLFLTFLFVNVGNADAQQKHEYVDLGLPSGTLWATCNVGAANPWDYGDYFAWGETDGKKSKYDWSTLKYCEDNTGDKFSKYNTQSKYGKVDNKTTLDPSDDAATANWGREWRMPTADELEALINECYWVWTTNYKGHSCNGYMVYKALKESDKGVKIFDGKTVDAAYSPDRVAHIFLPAAGWKGSDGRTSDARPYGYYWSSSLHANDPWNAHGLRFRSGFVGLDGWISRSCGQPVRPVRTNKSTSQRQTSPSIPITVNGRTYGNMIFVKGGTFQMGATSEQGSDAYSDEKPVHTVTLSDYYIGETEVTQGLWKAVMGSNPSYESRGIGDDLPVNNVSWNDCQDFIKKLNQQTGKHFRLPTEAEWEYAARGGSKSKNYKYSGSNTIGDVAWYTDNSGSKVHPVKSKSANELGIYGMSGNVWEWCEDWIGEYLSGTVTNPKGPSSGSDRVLRGGSWNNYARQCRVSYRDRGNPTNRDNSRGLRLLLSSQ